MSLTRKVLRRAPRVVVGENGVVGPAPGQHSKLARVKPLDPEYNRLMRRALKGKQTRNGQ